MTLDQVVTHQISQLPEVADTLTSGLLCGECQPRLDWFLTQVQRTCWPKVHIFSLLTIEESYVSVQRWQREFAGSYITLHFSSRRWVRCYSGTFLHCSSGDVLPHLPHMPQSTCSTVLQVWSHRNCTDYWKMKEKLCMYSAPLLKSKLFEYHSALVDLQQSSTLTHQCGCFLASFTANSDIISRRKVRTAICIFKT